MANYYVSSVAYTAVAQYANTTLYTLGQYIRQLAAPAFGSERVFKCTTGGTSGSSEPAWSLGDNATTAAGTATFTCVSGHEAEQASANWKAPCANLQAWFNQINATGNVYVSTDHTEANAASSAYNFPLPTNVICVSRGVGSTVPPANADVSLTPQGNVSCTVNQVLSWTAQFTSGLILAGGTSTGTGATTIRPRGSRIYLEHCQIFLGGTGGGQTQIGAGDFGRITMNDVSFKFAATSGGVSVNGLCTWDWYNSLAVVGSFAPAVFFASGTGDNTPMRLRGIDFSNNTSGPGATRVFPSTGSNAMTYSGPVEWEDCIVPQNFTMANMSAFTAKPGTDWRFRNCNAGNVLISFSHLTDVGYMNQMSTAARAGGATLGLVNYGFGFQKDATGANSFFNPYRGPLWTLPNTSTGSSKTLTMYLCATTALDNAQAWVEGETLEDAADTLGQQHSTRAGVLAAGTTLTTDTSDWTAGAALRANTTAYVVGNPVKVASNTGRLFICTAPGTSAGSEPAGYASATDGSTITDGTATFMAVIRYKITFTFTPGRAGLVSARPCFAPTGAQATTFIYTDPLITLT